MYLKRVELYGFKSFADRTVFDLAAGITAVLGPNGCGKSNVVDAIKWVLGESSAKNLRGTQMQDVIFAGAQGRKPLGMTEVSLIFDNADNALPLAFTEIGVTRRLYRSGDSEYEINKQPCRKRDIRDLFLDTGVGMSAYSFIEQGRVEALLQAKPEERRLVLEEAAGVSKYKQRRKESTARLDRTQQALLRINDIVEELDKNIKKVSRQAANAKRHQQLTANLRLGKTVHYTRLAADYLTQLSGLEKEKAAEEESFAQHSAHQIELTQLITARTTTEIELMEKVERSEREYRALQNELNHIQIDLATASEKRESLSASQTAAAARAESLSAKLSALTAATTTIREQLQTAEKELAEYQTLLHSQDGERGGLQRELTDCENRAAELRMKILPGITERRSEIRAAEAQVETRAQDAQNRLREHLANTESINRREQELCAQKNDLTQRFAGVQNQFTQLNEQTTAARTNENNLRTTIEQTARRDTENQRQLSALRSRHQTLKELADAHDGAFAGVKAVLQAKERGMCRDLLGMVADVLTVPAEYTVAIETALGGSAQDLITRTAAGAQECIQFLKTNHAGRATFLPLDRISPRSPIRENILKERGVVDEAFALVDFADEYQRAVEYLLNGILIVEDLTGARELAGGAAKGLRIVTLDGDIISPHGAMTGGHGNQQRGGLIARNAERDALARQISELETHANNYQRERDNLLNKLMNAGNYRRELEQQLATAVQTGGVLERELAVKNGEYERALADKTAFTETQNKLQQLCAAQQIETVNFNEEKVALQQREQETNAELEQLHFHQKTARTRLDEIGNSLAGVREKRGAASNAVNELTRRQQEIIATGNELTADLSACENLLTAAKTEYEIVQQRLTELHARENELLNQRAAIGDGDTGDKEQLRSLREQLNQLRDEEKNEQRAAAATAEAVNAVKVKISENKVRWETLVEKARVELGVENIGELAAKQISEPVISAATGEVIAEEKPVVKIDEIDLGSLTNEQLADLLKNIENKITWLGPVNLCAIDELAELEARAEFLRVEQEDIEQAAADLRAMITQLNDECDRKFAATFTAVNKNFQEMFAYLFDGGQAELILAAPQEGETELDRGIDIIAHPPGKSPKSLSLLSGGEKALCAVALLFAIFRCKPSPFCILDEVDGPLDESNIDRFMQAVRKFTADTQFIIISHSKRTMSMVDTIYGVTQEQPGVSARYSLQFSHSDTAENTGVANET